MTAESPVVFETRETGSGHLLGMATLNRPRQLNALNLAMCELMLDQFRCWASDERIVAVVLQGAGEKGYCGGGDVAGIVREIRAGGPQRFVYGDRFFDVEYTLDLLIHQFPKPFVVYSHGVCMGGGVGLMAGASHRIVSEQTRLAMPEIHIGLYPDVGAGWFLNRVPGRLGRLMAATGLVLNEADALFAGFADFFWSIEERDRLFDGLGTLAWTGHARSDRVLLSEWLLIDSRRYVPGLPTSNLRQYFDALRYLAAIPSPLGLRDALQVAADDDPWFAAPAQGLAKGSPTTAAVVYEYLDRCRNLSIAQVLELDSRMARRFQREHDFVEGVRALLIDKDKNPQWSPQRLEDVTHERVERHFI